MRTSIVAKRHNAATDQAFLHAAAKLAGLQKSLTHLAGRGSERLDDRLIDEACATCDWIRRAEPQSLVGAAVKLRMLLDPELGIESAFQPDEDSGSLRQVLAVIDRELRGRV
ncbi:MAG TPA: hypothetical protein VLV50_02400 [Stellaceae bacterium]|nr:hypothetical protein [Stellaceae bacterium]